MLQARVGLRAYCRGHGLHGAYVGGVEGGQLATEFLRGVDGVLLVAGVVAFGWGRTAGHTVRERLFQRGGFDEGLAHEHGGIVAIGDGQGGVVGIRDGESEEWEEEGGE